MLRMSPTSLPTFPTLTWLCLSTRIKTTSSHSRMATCDFHPDSIQFFLVTGTCLSGYVFGLSRSYEDFKALPIPSNSIKTKCLPRKRVEVETRQRSASEQPRYTTLANTSTFGITHRASQDHAHSRVSSTRIYLFKQAIGSPSRNGQGQCDCMIRAIQAVRINLKLTTSSSPVKRAIWLRVLYRLQAASFDNHTIHFVMSSANSSEKNRVFLLCGLGLIQLNTCIHFPWRNRGS